MEIQATQYQFPYTLLDKRDSSELSTRDIARIVYRNYRCRSRSTPLSFPYFFPTKNVDQSRVLAICLSIRKHPPCKIVTSLLLHQWDNRVRWHKWINKRIDYKQSVRY